MKYTKLNFTSNKEFEKNMSEFGARMAEFGSKMANLSSKNFDDFCIFNDINFSSQNGTSIITEDEKTIITTRDGDEIILKDGEIFLNGKKMKVDETCEKNDNIQEKSNNDSYEARFGYIERWLIILSSLMFLLIVAFLTFIFIS